MNRDLQQMAAPLEGGCLCGAVSYVSSAAPIWSANCHCRECQKLSGAPFVSAFSVPAQALTLKGATIPFQRTSESGNVVTTNLCAKCGTRINAQSSGNTALMNIFASTLRKPECFRPVANVYLCEAAGWIEPPKAIFNFPKMPPPPR